MAAATAPEQETTAVAEVISARFLAMVERQFTAELGTGLAWTEYEKTLAQHLFLKADYQLKTLEAKRNGKDVAPYVWENVNLPKLALDAVHRVNLGLDALIPNHIHPIPYWNSKLKKYDLDLSVGYVGKDFCRRRLAVEIPVDVIYELVYDTDRFVPHARSLGNPVESYEFEITKPFDRGKVIGGFGYIMYQDSTKNRLIIVTQRDFARAEAAAKSADFWGENKSRLEMQFKTIVHRVTDKLPLDPHKVNAASYAYVEAQDAEAEAERAADANANGEVIDVEPTLKDDAEGDGGTGAGSTGDQGQGADAAQAQTQTQEATGADQSKQTQTQQAPAAATGGTPPKPPEEPDPKTQPRRRWS